MKTALWDRTVGQHRETDFTDHEDWCIEAVREPKSQQLWLAKYSRAEVKFTSAKTFEIGGLTFHPPAENELSRHVRLPSCYVPTAPSVRTLLNELDSFFQRCLDLDQRYRFLLSCFVLSTWMVDRLPVAPYIALVGLPRSGKSTALRALYLLCRRSLITSDISSAAFYRLCDRWMPTLCIDEAATAGQQRTLFHLLRSGTTRDAVAFREKQSYRTFGAKVVVWNQMPDDEALNSRCIVIPMQETSRTDLERTTNADVMDTANNISAELATFRAVNYRGLDLLQIAGAERLRSRDRDLYEALALPIGDNSEACTHLLECLEYQRELNREPLPARELAVLESSFKVIHAQPDQQTYSFRQLKDESNKWLADSGERFKVNEKSVSGTLKTFGFVNRKRTKSGWVVIVDRGARKRLHELLLLYGVSSVLECLPAGEPVEPCEFCHALEKELTATFSVRNSAIAEGNGSAGRSGWNAREEVERGEHGERTIEVDGERPLPGGARFRSGNGHRGHVEVTRSEQVASQPVTESAVPIASSPNDGERSERCVRETVVGGDQSSAGPSSSESGNGHAPEQTQCLAGEKLTGQPATSHGSKGQGSEPPVPTQRASTTSDAGATQVGTRGSAAGEPHKFGRGGTEPPQAVEDSDEFALHPENLQEILAMSYQPSPRERRESDKKSGAREKKDPREESG